MARIVPVRRAKGVRWPDFAVRMKRRFPDGMMPGPPVSALMDLSMRLAREHTAALGMRSLDVLHVAAAAVGLTVTTL